MITLHARVALTALLGLGLLASAAARAEGYTVASTTSDDIELYVNARYAPDERHNGEAVLFVHGATYPGATFDTDLADGRSWMDRMAAAGYDVYAMDVRGYGRSTRPAAMRAPASENAPFARAEDVVPDIDDVVESIRDRSGVDRVNLVGWSWGTVTTGLYTATHADKVDRLVLYAPVYAYDNPGWTEKLADPDNPAQLADVGAYREVTRAQADTRWADQIDAQDPADWRDPAVFERWYDAMLATEPDGADRIKAPNGVLVDLWEIFNGRPVYDASRIEVPTLLIRGDDDPTATDADARGLFEALASPIKRYVVVGDATHFMALETHAPQLFAETRRFLDGAP